MIYVLAKNYLQFAEWRRSEGFTPQQVRYISNLNAARGIRIAQGDLVKLPGYTENVAYDARFNDAMHHASADF